jgi:N-acetyl-gamma-glutamyl-phosphate reductase
VDASDRVVLVSVIDNRLKRASGHAVQNLNVMLGLDERTAFL